MRRNWRDSRGRFRKPTLKELWESWADDLSRHLYEPSIIFSTLECKPRGKFYFLPTVGRME